jgi:hypothetical protein
MEFNCTAVVLLHASSSGSGATLKKSTKKQEQIDRIGNVEMADEDNS